MKILATAKAYKILGLLYKIFKNSISFEAKNSCTYHLLGPACHTAHRRGGLI